MHPEYVIKFTGITKALSPVQRPSYFLVPVYPGSCISIYLGSFGAKLNQIYQTLPDELHVQLKYYTSKVGEISFGLSRFVQKIVESVHSWPIQNYLKSSFEPGFPVTTE